MKHTITYIHKSGFLVKIWFYFKDFNMLTLVVRFLMVSFIKQDIP